MHTRIQRFLRGGRRRRGVEAVEFAMILPVFIIVIFATMEFSWYMFQKQGVVDAARVACRSAAQLDPRLDDVASVASARVEAELADVGVNCGSTHVCEVTITDLAGATPPRVSCEARVSFTSMTGLFGVRNGGAGSLNGMAIGSTRWGGEGVLPGSIRGASSAIYEGIPQ